MGIKTRNAIRLTASYITLVIIAIGCIYPALWIVLASFRPGKSLYSKTLIPESFTLSHYKELFTSQSFLFGTWYMNTLKIAVFSMIIGTILVLLTSYAVSRFRFKGRQNALSTILVLGMFPGFMSMIALYILLNSLDLLNTHAAMIIVYAAGAPLGGTLIMKGFLDTIPRSLDEAAKIDGATNFQIFRRIILPLSKPMITYMGLTMFVGPWVDFIFARLVLRTKENWTLAVGLWDLVNSTQDSNFTLFAAASVLIALPITILFIFLQRLLVDGMTAGASKG
ncbi:binding-protein-dependent transport systems inner membrane component [Paenibacillus vortex V453]|jgi:arabinogalactan oligomer/maltooligosaccharide transport system permease protein|uniref:Sugar ABC transporter permease n=2 Tax=Paenibacillus TaxID=44249 RepID=A0A163K5L6_9BACL|nr:MULTISPECIES: sugar ABC transporter permease [Paenibacillus]ANA80990.1 sugar ABC transporter permease [Paenibacillus glucanolyticus]AVV54938.1 sugar ABC transporter permease [Paenibacillus glucanolyticus]AWP29524.1 sugar ABC transporter permease [Paenibacillus sp. Cedars]EFU42595.1 binding-protein-dependent transport systems inner membrane component [Paenibacillus vortex V453]ETT36451.1 binding-protein-dependent transport systems inner membrane component [Paenibacillus sp. FSL R5-808]